MKTNASILRFVFALVGCVAAGAALAQGPLLPPGAPAPIYKTLEQVEPRRPISALPFTISQPGSYYLTTNLIGGAGAGILISASRVSLDLMGFEISDGAGSGIVVSGLRSNVWIRNGTVRGWSGWGVEAPVVQDCVFEKLQLSANGQPATAGGLLAGGSSVVRDCTASGNGTAGLQIAGDRNRIEGNHLTINDRGLRVTGVENVIIRNSAAGNLLDYEVAAGNDLGPVGRAATLPSPWGNIGAALFDLTVNVMGSGVVASMPGGISCGADCTEPYAAGSLVTLTATPGMGSIFTGWSGGGCMGTGPCVVTMDAAKSVTATFTIETYALTVSKAGAGVGNVSSTPTGVNCGMDCSESYASGTLVTLTATPAMGSTFAGWSGACTGMGSCVVTMDAAKSVTATFALDAYTLSIIKVGGGAGTVTSSPAGVNCGADCTEVYSAGTMVTLTAAPAVGSTFTGWSGEGCSGTGTCTVTMDAAKTVAATFALQNFTLSTAKAGTGTGTIASSPAGINCGADCTEVFPFGTTVTLTAAAGSGSTFSGWSGGGCSGTGTCVTTINAATTVTATFTLNTYALTVNKSGSGTGTVTSSPAGVNCGTDCSEMYNHGTMVTLTATPAMGSSFTGWSGGCTGTGTCTVTMDAAKTVTANFTLGSP